MRRATWQNGKRTVSGQWEWHWASQRFVIVLDQRDRVTGDKRRIVTAGSERDKPEWGNWRILEGVSA